MTADEVDKVRVAVRVRPLNKRERELGTTVVVDMQGNQTILYSQLSNRRDSAANEDSNHNPRLPPGKRRMSRVSKRCQSGQNRAVAYVPSFLLKPRTFAFDHCFMSMSPADSNYSSQQDVFNCLGRDLLDSAFRGYNGCIFAYGQTGSGKSYTMMGTRTDEGIIPRLCDALFSNIAQTTAERLDVSFKVEVSYMEIYNEKVHDLLDVKGGGGGKKNLRVREHKLLGPYVDGLSQLVVASFNDIDNLMSEGNKSRTVAATNMNSESSRSHAVFNIILTQTLTDLQTEVSGEKVSKLSLVDLAGSERAQKTGAVGERLREGSNINRSLTTLGLVISALADQGSGGGKFVPYRDSVLTWLLKDNLGGNSKTVMVATLSPASDNYEETLSTLRYADRAKRIVNHAVINEDPNAKIIRELREEVDRLRKELDSAMEKQAPELADKLEESEKLMKELTKTWEEKLEETERIHKERHETLEKMGISVEGAGIKVENTKFFLVNLNADPSLNELLVYYLKHDQTQVGASELADIRLNGLGIKPEHCSLDIVPPDIGQLSLKQAVYLTPAEGARTLVNGKPVLSRTRLKHGDRILWGTHSFYRLSCPRTTKKKKEEPAVAEPGQEKEEKEEAVAPMSEGQMEQSYHAEGDAMMMSQSSMLVTSTSSSGFEHMMGFDDAQAEVMQAELSWPCDPINSGVGEYDVSNEANQQLQTALARQKAMYEEQLELLKSQLMLSPMQGPQTTPMTPFSPWNSSISSGLNTGMSVQNLHIQSKYREWAQEREQLLMQSLARLREQVARANTLVREANFMAADLGKRVEYSVTLQVPVENLTPNKKRAGLVSEPAVQVTRSGRPPQVWSMTKFENKIIDMREVYEEYKERALSSSLHAGHSDADTSHLKPLGGSESAESETGVPDVMYFMPGGQLLVLNEDGVQAEDEAFFDSQENHSLIGVANLFLASLFHNVEISYYVPIINQQGEISGKLQMKLHRLEGHMPTPGVDRDSEALPGLPFGSSCTSPQESGYRIGSNVRIRVSIIQAVGLPVGLSHFAFCQYQLWGQSQPTMVGPAFQPDFMKKTGANKVTVHYNHTAEFNIPLTDDFIEHCAESALSVEVWGNPASGFIGDKKGNGSRSANGGQDSSSPEMPGQELTRFSERWQELCRRLELWVCIEELNDNGIYEKVEVIPSVNNTSSSSTHSSPASCPDSPGGSSGSGAGSDDVGTGGVYQLKHGQSRRVTVAVRPKRGGGDLPLICESVQTVCMGCVTHRVKAIQRGLDSYQEVDLNLMRDCWSEAVRRRQDYLHERLQLLVDRAKKTSAEEERERSLMDQWMQLTAERHAVLVPEPGSGIPGAPASWNPVDGMERHCPVVFLNLKPEDMTSLSDKLLLAGHNCLLPKEHSLQNTFIQLPLVKHYRSSVIGAVGQWDASMHDSIHLNRVTPANERVYMILKVIVRLSHPATMDLILRKRVCVNIYRKQSLRGYLARQWNKYMSADDSSLALVSMWSFRTLGLSFSWAEMLYRHTKSVIHESSRALAGYFFSTSQLRWTGVTYQIVSSIPQASQEMEDRESLARLAASEDVDGSTAGGPSSDGQSYIEKYIRSVSAVEGILQLDRLRQEVAVKEALATEARRKRRTAMAWELQQRVEEFNNSGLRKYISVPNLQAMNRSSSMTSLTLMQTSAITPSAGRTESVFNLSEQTDMSPGGRLVDNSKFTNSKGVRKRPEPPKGLLGRPNHLNLSHKSSGRSKPPRQWGFVGRCWHTVAAKNPLISPLSTGPKYGTLVGGLSSASRPSMGTLEEEERLRKPMGATKTDENESSSNENRMSLPSSSNLPISSNFESHTQEEMKQEQSIGLKISENSISNHEHENGNIEAMDSKSKESEVADDTCSDFHSTCEKKNGREDVTAEPAISSSITQESLSETTGPSSGYDSQAISTTTLESEENLAAQAAQEVEDADTPRAEDMSEEPAAVVEPDEEAMCANEASLRKDVSLNEEDWKSIMDGPADGDKGESLASWIRPGESVKVDTVKGRQPGWIRFVGSTQFAPGTWVGVELEQAEGKNDGSVQSVRYFKCRKRHGVFVRQDKLTPMKRRASKGTTAGRVGQATSGSGGKARK